MTLSEREQERDILFGVINRFIGYFTRETVPNTSNDTTREYPFVAMDTRQAYEQIRLAIHHLHHLPAAGKNFSFIDIGCGIGNIMLLAEMMECEVFGIEKDVASYSIARQLVGEECVSQEDIWQYSHIGKFDIVYYFRPFSEKTLQLQFESHVEQEMRPGAILIANRRMGFGIEEDTRFLRLDPEWPVWQKIAQ